MQELSRPKPTDETELAFVDFGNLLLARCREEDGTNNVTPSVRMLYHFVEPNGMEQRIIQEPYRFIFSRFNTSVLYANEEVQKCLRLHIDSGFVSIDPNLGEQGRAVGQHAYSLTERLFEPLFDYIVRTGTLLPNNDELRKSYNDWCKSLEQEKEEWEIIVPLTLFYSSRDIDFLYREIGIRRFDAALKNRIFRSTWMPEALLLRHLSLTDFLACGFCLYVRKSMTRTEAANWSLVANEIRKMVTSLRLTHIGFIGAPIAYKWRFDGRWNKEVQSYPFDDLQSPQFRRAFDFEQCDLSTLRESATSLFGLEEDFGELKNALSWFNSYYTKTTPEDRIISLTISLEASLTYGARDQLSQTLALRGARLLERKRSPKDTFHLLKALYEARSGCVHGGSGIDEKQKDVLKYIRRMQHPIELHKLPDAAEEVVRDCLFEYLRMLSNGKSIEEVNTELDLKAAGLD